MTVDVPRAVTKSGKPLNGKSEKVSGKPSERIEEILKLMEEENLQELEIVDGSFEVKLVRHGRTPVSYQATGRGPAPRAAAPKPAADDAGKFTPVKSPLAGVFYRAPSPQAASFCKEGDVVSAEKPLCIIEAMKVLNEIHGGVAGTVMRILVENGKPVSAGQTLFLIDPAG